MKYETIKTQLQLNELLEKFDWSLAFIKEMYTISPSYIDAKNQRIVAPDVPPTTRILIVFENGVYAGLELIFERVKHISLSFSIDLHPKGTVNEIDNSVDLHFGFKDGIRAERVKYIILDEQCWGWQVRYGKYYHFDELGLPFEDLD